MGHRAVRSYPSETWSILVKISPSKESIDPFEANLSLSLAGREGKLYRVVISIQVESIVTLSD